MTHARVEQAEQNLAKTEEAPLKAGQTLRVTFTTLEPLGSKPTVSFKQPGRAAKVVTATRRTDGSYLATFKVQAGGAGAASIQISARDSGGRLNRSTLSIQVVS